MVDSPRPAKSPDAAARQLACEVFVLGFPLILMDAVRRAHPLASSRFRRLPPGSHELLPGLFDDDPDCLHSCAVMDLGLGPAALHLPNTHGRYLSVTLIDAAGEPFASLGSRTDSHLINDAVVAGPHWHGEVRPGMKAFRSPSDMVWAVSRILARSAADHAIVEGLAARQFLSPALGPADEADAAPTKLDMLELTAIRQVAGTEPHLLLFRMHQLIARAPRAAQERLDVAIRGRLSMIQTQFEASPQSEEAMARGFADGWKAIQAARTAQIAPPSRDWTSLDAGPAALTPTSRAALVLQRLGAPVREDVLTLRCNADESGRPLTGEEQYRIRFAADGLPPAQSAWRLTAHGRQASVSCGVIGDHSPLVVGENNALELLIQRDPPARPLSPNWLRAPPGPFELKLRLYGPTAEALAGSWRMVAVERLGSRGDGRPEAPGRRPLRSRSRRGGDLNSSGNWRTSA
ncbi:DUF1254 domain-containing protein [Phenylobacterium sp. LjRoot219]|uniref:DUF1254 domain-containing protein n=1 Tax=Phenylobacterium sp. LjRoot219 TaxID=3342283 RepID=UPI003ECF17C3